MLWRNIYGHEFEDAARQHFWKYTVDVDNDQKTKTRDQMEGLVRLHEKCYTNGGGFNIASKVLEYTDPNGGMLCKFM